MAGAKRSSGLSEREAFAADVQLFARRLASRAGASQISFPRRQRCFRLSPIPDSFAIDTNFRLASPKSSYELRTLSTDDCRNAATRCKQRFDRVRLPGKMRNARPHGASENV